uniref:Putative isac anti-complement n=1 Tax=Ixodes ricinus TaxID=34613 RepID=A0A0K8R599_IXORI
MEAALIHMLLGITFAGIILSQYESAVAYDRKFYGRVLGRNPGICGAWYRNPNQTEEIMNCVLGKVPTPVKEKWEKYMNDNRLTKPKLVSEMCNLTTIMPGNFTNYETPELTKEYNNKAEKAGIECTANITGWNTTSQFMTTYSKVRGLR